LRLTKRLRRGWRHSRTLLRAALSPERRTLVWQMFAFERSLPPRFNRPLPEMMAGVTPPPPVPGEITGDLSADTIRKLADAVAAWRIRSPLGICLRRSLLRYHFLRRIGVPVVIIYGARLKTEAEGGGLGGHAWITLHGIPWYEVPQDYQDFVPMFHYPAPEGETTESEHGP
jgi:hypothetical protein